MAVSVSPTDPVLKLYISYITPPPAAEIGKILQNISRAFDEFNLAAGLEKHDLVVTRLSIQSFSAWLEIAEKIGHTIELGQLMLDHRHLLSSFCDQLCNTVHSALNARPITGGRAIWNALSAMAKPVARGDADGVEIRITGTNGNVLEIKGKLSANRIETVIRSALIYRPTEVDLAPIEPPHPLDLSESQEDVFDYSEERGNVTTARLVFRNGRWQARLRDQNTLVTLTNVRPEQLRELRQKRQYSVSGIVDRTSRRPTFAPHWATLKRV